MQKIVAIIQKSFPGFLALLLLLTASLGTGPCSFAETARNDFSDLDGMLIGVMTGSVQEKYVQDQIPEADIAYFNNTADLMIALKQRKIDAGAFPLLMVRKELEEDETLVCDDRLLGSDDVCFAFPKTDAGKALQSEFNIYLSGLKENGETEKLRKIYFEDPNGTYAQYDFSELTGTKGTIRYGTSTQMSPFCFRTGNGITGIDTEILYGFCREYGYQVQIEDTSFPSVLAGLTTGSYDMGGGGIAYTQERAEKAYFSDAYFDSLQVLVEIKGSGVGTSGKTDLSETSGNFTADIKQSFHNTFIKEDRWKLLIEGLFNTLLVTAGSFLLSTLIGILVAGLMLSGSGLLRKLAQIYHYLMQGMPLVVILMLLYYVIFSAARINPILVAVIGFGLSSGSGIAEVLYGSITAVQKGELEASMALGFSAKQTFLYITLPQAIRKALPGYRGQLVALLKGTSIVGYIAIQDITKMADIIRSRSFEAFLPIMTTAAVYFAFIFLIRFIFTLLLKKTDHKGKRRLIKGIQA